jgi:hypothetical protein
MKDQAYFDTVIAAMQPIGFKFLAQVHISTDDMPYHVTVAWARCTDLLFYVEGKNLITRMTYTEDRRDNCPEADTYYRYWSLELIADFSDWDKASALETMRDVTKPPLYYEESYMWDEPRVPVYRIEPQLAGFWNHMSSSHMNHREWRFEPSADSNTDVPIEPMIAELAKFKDSISDCLSASPFPTLLPSWPPTYVFGGSSYGKDKQYQQCTNLYWTRFGDKRKILRKLIKKLN